MNVNSSTFRPTSSIPHKSSAKPVQDAAPQDSFTFSDGPGLGTKVVLSGGAGLIGAGLGAFPLVGALSNSVLGFINSHPEGNTTNHVSAGVAFGGAVANIAGILFAGAAQGASPGGQATFALLTFGLSGLAGGVAGYASAANALS